MKLKYSICLLVMSKTAPAINGYMVTTVDKNAVEECFKLVKKSPECNSSIEFNKDTCNAMKRNCITNNTKSIGDQSWYQ